MLAVSGLDLRYGEAQPVLEDVNLSVGRGELVSIVGPSGCGKSTLLRIISRLQAASRGSVSVAVGPREVGILFQDDALLPWRTARENVALGLRAHGASRSDARACADQWLNSVGLAGLGTRYPNELSGGQRKRVSIAQVLALHPKLLLMDEPFASLDAIVRRYITDDLLWLVKREEATVLMVTHDLEEAVLVADRVVLLSNGPRAHIKSVYDVPTALRKDRAHARENAEMPRLVKRIWDDLSEEITLPRSRPHKVASVA